MKQEQFDKGFAHVYPEQHGLSEGTIDNQRVILSLPDYHDAQVDAQDDSLLFPITNIAGLDFFMLPDDSRDLSSFARLLKSEKNAEYSGQLLAEKLIRTYLVFEGIPNDTILPRFSVFSDENAQSSRYGGIDIKFLPPYINLSGNLGEANEMIRNDFFRIGNVPSKIIDSFLETFIESV